ncbi:putative inorganic carbon (hco3(-)) transporter [Candidatus Magnetomoraceae bacterium gMMP-1]
MKDNIYTLINILEPLFPYVATAFFLYLIIKSFVYKDKPAGIILILLCTLIFDYYLDTGLGIPGVSFATIKYSELIIFYFLLIEKNQSKSRSHFRKTILKLYMCYAAFFFIASIRSSIATAGYNEGFYAFRYEIIDVILIYLLVSSGFKSLDDYKRFIVIFAIFAILISISNIQMYMHGWDTRLFPYSEVQYDYISRKHSQHMGRYGGYFMVSNRSGLFCSMTLPFLIGGVGFVESVKHKSIIIFSIIAVGIALLTTNSRSAILGLLFGLTIFFIMYKVAIYKKIVIVCLAFMAVSILAPSLITRVTDRFSTIEKHEEDASAANRILMWKTTFNIIASNLLFGIGYGEVGFSNKYQEYGGTTSVNDNPHNSYISIAVQIGTPALMIYIVMMGVFFKFAVKFNRNIKELSIQNFHTGMIAALVAISISVFFNPILFVHPISKTIWILISLTISVAENFSKIANKDIY